MTGLYIHVPFCESKCPYCDFNSWKAPLEEQKQWIELVLKEICLRCHPDTRFETVYIGGGTPSVLDAELFSHLMARIHRNLDLSGVEEFTLEANPSTLDRSRCEAYLKWNITRISIGIQSFRDSCLKTLGRAHDAVQALKAVNLVHSQGFPVSIDLMFGIPGQNIEALLEDVRTAVTLPLSHLSFYGLTIEKGTLFHKWERENRLQPVDKELYDSMYFKGSEILEDSGLTRYEVSSFAKKGKESIHNLNYWNHCDYLGVGPGSHSLSRNRRAANKRRFPEYRQWVLQGCPTGGQSVENLDLNKLYMEAVWLGLRTARGIDPSCLSRTFGKCPPGDRLEKWTGLGYMECTVAGRYRLRGRGWVFLDEISLDLLS
jgi:oxygen-independent coproporphyrinogen-3 oxidase